MEENNIFPKDPDKTYGLMEVVKGSSLQLDKKPEETKEVFPHLIIREIIALLLLIAFISLIALFLNAPLEEIANPNKTPNPAKAPWYFLALQELLHYFPPVVAGIFVPAFVLLSLFLLPYLDRNPSSKPKDRKLAIIVFSIFVTAAIILTIIGTFFRGENWHWTTPWS